MRGGMVALWCFAAGVLGDACTTLKVPFNLQARIDSSATGAAINLPPGTLSGDFVVSRPVTLRGAGRDATVLSGHRTLIIRARGVVIESLAVLGTDGAVRLEAGAEATFRHSRIEGPGISIAAASGSSLTTEDISVSCPPAGFAGIRVEAGKLVARDLTVRGPCRRNIDVNESDAEFRNVVVSGGDEAGLHDVGGTVVIRGLKVSDVGSGAAGLFAAKSHLDAQDVDVSGGEEGVLLRGGESHFENVVISASSGVGFASVTGASTLTHARLIGPFREAALSSLSGDSLTASDIGVEDAGVAGLLAVKSQVNVTSMRVHGIRTDRDGDFGHGFVFQRARGSLRSVSVARAAGAAIYASGMGANAQVDGCEADEVAAGATAVMDARVTIRRLQLSNAAVGVMASGDSLVQIADSSIHALVGMLACDGSHVDEMEGVKTSGGVKRRACSDEAVGSAWQDVLRTQ
jgi:hypothetical protein